MAKYLATAYKVKQWNSHILFLFNQIKETPGDLLATWFKVQPNIFFKSINLKMVNCIFELLMVF